MIQEQFIIFVPKINEAIIQILWMPKQVDCAFFEN